MRRLERSFREVERKIGSTATSVKSLMAIPFDPESLARNPEIGISGSIWFWGHAVDDNPEKPFKPSAMMCCWEGGSPRTPTWRVDGKRPTSASSPTSSTAGSNADLTPRIREARKTAWTICWRLPMPWGWLYPIPSRIIVQNSKISLDVFPTRIRRSAVGRAG